MTARTHGAGAPPWDFAHLGACTVLEEGVRVFHADRVFLGDGVYVGHDAILKGYYKNELRIGARSWIGQQCFLHAAGGLTIGERVGVGPGVRIITSAHALPPLPAPIMDGELRFAPVVIGDGADLGVGATVLPGVTVGAGAQVGAGAVLTADVSPGSIVAGVPARRIGARS